ncbi:methyltransferase domain-containing protein [Nonomuraea jiangxiensis]|uniref:Protein-L-isoaspartate O-methyltransferase n=1 Tax=Nonomuraea jiangxiensis TaxID=633440 RepID=A0A1G8T2P0_9ACTN|nr:methyltransferase domain-containing protein [Nonomuraea jiangxiensis]SDJ35736.1 protein-L-isoaspartate(D-aspartate) O-methyltransferase [Nonomuraea jiangxiensis]
MTDHEGRVDRFIADIEDRIGPLLPSVEAALRAVPRALFIPDVALASPGSRDEAYIIDRDSDPGTWWEAVYTAADPIITQIDDGAGGFDSDGAYTSSNSAPVTVAELLELLSPKPRQRVLEVGTGTGWTAALLSYLVGADRVTSIEIDAALSERAAKNVSVAGYEPRLVIGDGAAGHPDSALYDRVHVTCSVYRVPYAWVEQCRPGGLIVAPFETGVGCGRAIRLVVGADGTAVGRFRGSASYMPIRSQRVEYPPEPDVEPVRASTRVDPRTIAEAPPGAALAIAALTGLHVSTAQDDDLVRVWVLNPDRGDERAMTVWDPDLDQWPVFQIGDRPVWDEVTDAYFRWVSWGEPGRDRYGITVAPDGQSIWLDRPDNVLS